MVRPRRRRVNNLKVGQKIPPGATDPIRTDFKNKGHISLTDQAFLAATPTGIGFQIIDPAGLPSTAPPGLSSVIGYSIDAIFNVSIITECRTALHVEGGCCGRDPRNSMWATRSRRGPSHPISSFNLLANGIDLSQTDAKMVAATSPFRFEIDDVRAKNAGGNEILTEHYPIDINFGLYTPDILPGWADPANAISARNANRTTPKPQLISFGTMGTYSVNYRNEPLPLRVDTPVKGKPESTDLAYAYASIDAATRI